MILLAIILICFVIFLFKIYLDKKYEDFVYEHSTAIKTLKRINKEFTFVDIPNLNMSHDYDNERFYDSISPRDYLTYQLVYKSKIVRQVIIDTAENRRKYNNYLFEIKDRCALGKFDSQEKPENEGKLIQIEKNILNSLMLKPTTNFSINIKLWLTNINGQPRTSKTGTFNETTIEEILSKLTHKIDGFYTDDEIWQSICRVERGRVSNKMRFAIYERDGYRCKKCHRSGQFTDLEIDHIFPISKGGKSEFDNLQTLCSSCNASKSNTVERGAVNPRAKWQGINVICDKCGAPMVLKKGKYGDFYGCSNYPNCRFTKQK